MNSQGDLHIRLLGEMALFRDGAPLDLPPSKKTRALLAYLAVTGRAHRRESLCLMFWDLPDDPRGALRWSLSKLRPLVDAPERSRILADRESVRFDAAGVAIDALEVRRGLLGGPEALAPEALARLAAAFRGAFLEGLELPNCPDFQAWLVAQRDETRVLHARVLRALVARPGADPGADPEAALPHARALVRLERHEEAAWIALIRLLAASGRRLEAEQQLEAARTALNEVGPGHDHGLELAWQRINTPGEAGAAARAEARPGPAPDIFTDAAPAEPAPAPKPAALPIPEKPSIAILPFAPEGEGAIGAGVAEGLAADLAERLGHDPRLFVVARTSAFSFGARPERHAEVRDGLGVRYVLEGALRGDAHELGLATRLHDAARGEVVWSRRFACPLEGVFALERDLAEAVTRSIDPGAGGVPDLTFGLPYPRPEAWLLYQDGALRLYRRAPEDLVRALELFEEALRLDPDFARARAAILDALYYQLALDHVVPDQAWREAALQKAREAAESGRRDAALSCALGQGYLIVRQPQAAVPAFEAAVELNPSFAWAHYGLGAARVLSGSAGEALPHLERAVRLSPRDTNMGSFLLRTADAYLFLRRYEDAVACARRAIREPLFQWSRHAVLLSALGHLGRFEEAREALDTLLRKRPDFSVEMVRRNHLYTDRVELEFVAEPQLFVDQNEFAHLLDGLRKAGVPTR